MREGVTVAAKENPKAKLPEIIEQIAQTYGCIAALNPFFRSLAFITG